MDDMLAGTHLGDYEVENQLGRGGMGVVYRARQVTLDRAVAIKVLPPELCMDPDYVNRFLREARAAAHLNHPNIIRIFDAGVLDNIYFFVMEFVDGKNLGQVVREEGRFGEREALYAIGQAANGLVVAHKAGIVHRDIKPENLMVASDGFVKIGDLGLAKWKPNEQDSSLTASGSTMGTPYYISPEQIRGLVDIDGRADIYSLGMTLYHLLAGKPAFCNGTAPEIMARHLTEPLPPLETLNPDISKPTLQLVVAMTAKKREDRIPEMTLVADQIADILGEERTYTPSMGTRMIHSSAVSGGSSRFWNQALRMIGAILGGLVLVLFIVIGWKVHQQEKKSQPIPIASGPVRLATPPPAPKFAEPPSSPKSAPSASQKPSTQPNRTQAVSTSSAPEKPKAVPRGDPKSQPNHIEGAPGVETEDEKNTASSGTTPTFPPLLPPDQKVVVHDDMAPPLPSSDHEPAVSVAIPREHRVETVIERPIFQGPEMIRDISIYSRPDNLQFEKQPRRGFDRDGSEVNSWMGQIERYLEIEVGQMQGVESKALVASMVFLPANTTEETRKLVKKIEGCTEAILEIKPVSFIKLHGPRVDVDAQKNDFIEIEVNRVLKKWGDGLRNPDEIERLLGKLRRFNQGERMSLDSLFKDRREETSWEYASTRSKLQWKTKGASNPGFDYDGKSIPLCDSERTSTRITIDMLDHPLSFNILPDLQRLAKDFSESGKPVQHEGWLIRCVRGSGMVRFTSSLGGSGSGPRILLKVKRSTVEESGNLQNGETE